MADMFGAPIGIDKALETQREGMLANVKALHTLGEIEGQPGKRTLEAAQARYYNAKAAEDEASAAEELALRGAVPGLMGEPSESLADPLLRLARFAGSKGYTKKQADLLGKASQIQLREQQRDTSASNQELHQLQAQRQTMEQNAALAASATDPETYARLRAQLVARGEDVGDLPENFEEAKPLLAQLVTQGTRAIDTLRLRERRVVDAANVKAAEARVRSSTAAASASEARVRLLTQEYNDRKANDGDRSPSVVALREQRIASLKKADIAREAAATARTEAQIARDRLRFPPPTSVMLKDPYHPETGLKKGQAYSTPRHGVRVWTGLPGDDAWGPMTGLPARPLSVAEPDPDDPEDED